MKKILFMLMCVGALFSCKDNTEEVVSPTDEYEKIVENIPGLYITSDDYEESGYGRVVQLNADKTTKQLVYLNLDADPLSVDSTYEITGTWDPFQVKDQKFPALKLDMQIQFQGDKEELLDTAFILFEDNVTDSSTYYAWSNKYGLDAFVRLEGMTYEEFAEKLNDYIQKHTKPTPQPEPQPTPPTPPVNPPTPPVNPRHPNPIIESAMKKGQLNSIWMSLIDDKVPVAELSIPGSHDALSYRVTASAQMQTMDIKKQLLQGSRYFDMRYYLACGKVYPCHDDKAPCINLFWTIRNELEKLEKYLKDNPSEGAIIILKHDMSQTKEKIDKCRKWLEDKALNKDIYIPYNSEITLGELRGKIMLLYRGSEWSDKPGYLDKIDREWQDECEIESYEKLKAYKLDDFEENVKKRMPYDLTMSKRVNKWHFNHASGYYKKAKFNFADWFSDGYHPVEYSRDAYPWMLDILKAQPKDITYGIIPMDFIGRNDNVRESASVHYFHVNAVSLTNQIVYSNIKFLKDIYWIKDQQ